MISGIHICNFKSLRNIVLGLERFTILVGPNGCGKSSVLQALNGFCRVFEQSAMQQQPRADDEINKSLSRGAPGPVELTVKAGSKCYRYTSLFNPPGGGTARPPTLMEAAHFQSETWNPSRPDAHSKIVPRAILLRLSPQNLTASSFNQNENDRIAADGTGLHVALASMALNEPETWQRFQNDLREILPTIRRLRHAKIGPGRPPALLFDTVVAESLSAEQMSEGSLLVTGLLCAMYAPDRPNLILLDDIDRGLHPKAQNDLVTLLRRFLDRNPDLQFVSATHSPYLLNCMAPEEVRLLNLREDGSTVCAPISTHPQFAKWKEEMAPGELWSLFGERWLLEGATK